MKKDPCIWLRAETKEFEERTPLVPSDAGVVVRQGFAVHLESSANRIFKDREYEAAGCRIVEAGSWRSAPENAYVLGIKELPEEASPIRQTHLYFAHAYKGQSGAFQLLRRFKEGNGALLDLEYLTDDQGRRVVAFGRWAGFAGAALGLDILCHQRRDPQKPYPPVNLSYRSHMSSYTSYQLTQQLAAKLPHLASIPRIIILGAKGRSGRGAVELFEALGLETTKWDIEETTRGGPFEELLDYDLLVNCVFLREAGRPFLTRSLIEKKSRRLSVIADVSCDVGNPGNALPIYETTTDFRHPTHRLIEGDPPLDVMAIDHLPSLLPAESSADFSSQLLPHLLALLQSADLPPVWQRARDCFLKKSGP